MAQFNDYNSLLNGLNVSGTGFNTANSTPVINTPSNDPFAVRRQELRDNSDNGTEELTHRAPASGYGTLGTQPTGGRDVSISMVEFNAVIEGIVGTRPLLKPQDIPALLRFGIAPEVVQRVELKADLLVLTRQVEAHDLKLIKQWSVSKDLKEFLRQLVAELLRTPDVYAYKVKFGDRAKRYIEKAEREAGTKYFTAAWEEGSIMQKKVMKVIEYEAGQERSAIKEIIEKSIQEGWDIIKLAVAVVNGYNIRPSAELQIRLAYIRSLRAGQHGDFTTRNFWNQVDAKMADVRKSLTATTFYSECLAWDQGKWPVQQSSRDSLRDVETLATGV